MFFTRLTNELHDAFNSLDFSHNIASDLFGFDLDDVEWGSFIILCLHLRYLFHVLEEGSVDLHDEILVYVWNTSRFRAFPLRDELFIGFSDIFWIIW